MQLFGIVLVIIIGHFSIALADKSKIIGNIEVESWMSKENLTTLLEVSFDTSVCCNVVIADDAVGIENIFNEFASVYPYKYMLNSQTYDCTDYLMISTYSENLVTVMPDIPTSIGSVHLLLVVNGDVEESSGLLNASMYRNAYVNIAARNGLWMLSESFLELRSFKEVVGFHEMEPKRGYADLQGRELETATFNLPPFNYLRSTVNLTRNGVMTEYFIANGRSELDGIEVQILMVIAERLNFTWTIRQSDPILRFGKRNGSTWETGLVAHVFHKRVHIAFAAIWIILDASEFSNMTESWAQTYESFFVPRPKIVKSFFALVSPLSKEVWAAVLVMLILQSIYVFTRAWINPQISKRYRNFLLTFTELMGQLLGMWMPSSMQGLHLQFHLWHMIGILLVTAYSSNLAARLATTIYENRIDTIKEFVASNLTWGSQEKPNFDDLFNDYDPDSRKIQMRYIHETSDDDRHRRVLEGNYAILGRGIDSVWYPRSDAKEEDLKLLIHLLMSQIMVKGFRVMHEPTALFYAGYSVQPWLLHPMNKVLFQLRECGISKYHIGSVLHRRAGSAYRELTVEHDGPDGPQVLTLTPLGVGFSILILGLTLSTLVFLHELKFFNKATSTYVLRAEVRKKWKRLAH